MTSAVDESRLPHLIWVHWAEPELDAATYFVTTRELRKLDWRVTFVLAGTGGAQQRQGVDVLCIPRPQIYFFWQFAYHLRLLRVLFRQWSDVDVIMFHQMSAPWLLPLRFVRYFTRKPRPLIVMDTRTVSMHVRATETWKEKLNRWFYFLMNRLANRLADGQTAITTRMAQSVHIPPHQLWGVWPSGVNPAPFAEAKNARQWPADGEPIALVYVGALRFERNLMELARAVEAANAAGMRFTLTFVGAGTQARELAEFASSTDQRVNVVPPMAHERIPQFLASGHVGVLPFPDEEKFRVSSPIKMFEYMASGLPILATRIACHTDVVQDAEFAFWAEDATDEGLLEALRNIWENRAKIAALSDAAAEAADAWTWKKSAEKLATALNYGLSCTQPRHERDEQSGGNQHRSEHETITA